MGPESSDDDERGSKLGRKDHWDKTYALELDNLQHNGDEGEIWFGEDVMETMVDWTVDLLQKEHPLLPLEAAILDVGTGNGVLPLELASHGFCNLTGSDYSEAAIQLARAVAENRGIISVRWVVDDLLHTSISDRFDVITDKGTYDAVGLSQGAAANRQLYISAVRSLLKPEGLLVITSCNTTREELMEDFCGGEESGEGCECAGKGEDEAGPDQAHMHSGVAAAGRGAMRVFEYVDHVRTYPVFRFGGVEGSKVCTVAFRRT
ncbi:g7675 [Coccomyxa elongata]